MVTVHPTALAGLVCLQPRVFTDHRGEFVKTYHDQTFRELGLPFETREEFFSTSRQHVLRGMHFQIPPADHVKLVYCITGAVLDVVLDLRRQSPTYGQAVAEELSAANRRAFYIPSGFAHGFLALTEGALMVYKTSTVHAPACDRGIRWDSFGFAWPLGGVPPILSQRDQDFPALADFHSPF
jgi:dTDP-4-dehydrorhamnose 3,5-epimerase